LRLARKKIHASKKAHDHLVNQDDVQEVAIQLPADALAQLQLKENPELEEAPVKLSQNKDDKEKISATISCE